ncbi:MAG: hypothetical protein ACJ72E_16850, partial [Marmoricola sp.]
MFIKYLLAAAALVVAGVPAALGTVGNASFTRDVPVRVPEQAQTGSATPGDDAVGDDHGNHAEPGDDRGDHGTE